MPDHCHLLLNAPAPESISRIMRVFKYGVTFNLGIGAFWQSRFHLVIPKHGWKILEYIHENPVKAQLCSDAKNYPWSSASGEWDVSRMDS